MSFVDNGLLVCFKAAGPFRQHTGESPQPHGSAQTDYLRLARHKADYRAAVMSKLNAPCIRQSSHIAGEFHHGALHAQGDSKKRNVVLPRILHRLNLPFHTTYPKSSRYHNPI